jgi:pilus assembly protein Flp/PilA
MQEFMQRLARDETGTTAIEYALIAGVIALGVIVSVTAIGDGLNGILNNSANELNK